MVHLLIIKLNSKEIDGVPATSVPVGSRTVYIKIAKIQYFIQDIHCTLTDQNKTAVHRIWLLSLWGCNYWVDLSADPSICCLLWFQSDELLTCKTWNINLWELFYRLFKASLNNKLFPLSSKKLEGPIPSNPVRGWLGIIPFGDSLWRNFVCRWPVLVKNTSTQK